MTAPSKERFHEEASALLQHYSFDLSGYSTDFLITGWRQTYAASWIRAAVIEALYQGRYKAVSVEQILLFWLRRGQPLRHFNHEFERIVCNQSTRRRSRKNCLMLSLSEASLSTSASTSSAEPGGDRVNPHPYSIPTAETETDQPPEVKEQQWDSQNSNESTREYSPENDHSKRFIPKIYNQKFASLGDLTEPSPIESSLHSDDDFELPDTLALFDQLWQLKSSAQSSKSHSKTTSDGVEATLTKDSSNKHYPSIDQFKPQSDRSECYLKLRAVAQHANDGISKPDN